MYTDALLKVSSEQEVLTTAVSTYSIDLTQSTDIGADVGEGNPLYMLFTVTTAFTRAAGALTVTFNVITDDDVALGSPTVLAATDAIAKASLTVGAQFYVRIPPQIASLGLRYLGASYTVSATADTGKVSARVVNSVQDGKKFYASGFSVS